VVVIVSSTTVRSGRSAPTHCARIDVKVFWCLGIPSSMIFCCHDIPVLFHGRLSAAAQRIAATTSVGVAPGGGLMRYSSSDLRSR
jgi:hypothetical protein